MGSRGILIFVVAVGLSLSVGWGIRGNYGHETGAMIPGALAALAALVLSRRDDWVRRAGSFAFFGALGWSFGGSISYMQVIAYTHSGHSLSVWYGFACLFVIGFLWAIFGAVGTALPACLSEAQLRSLYPLVFTIFGAWCLQDYVIERWFYVDPAFRQRDPLYWYDTDWVGITVALAATLSYAAVRRRFDFAVKLATTLCAGWWCGFAVFVLLLGWRMTPPRGDNWAGCAGMAAALMIFLAGQRLNLLLYAGLLGGTAGGVGFALANCLKLLGISTGLVTNWHSVLEQSYGFINGVGIALVMWVVRRRAPVMEMSGPAARSERLAAVFVLVAVTYLNLWKNVGTWVKASTVPPEMYGWPAGAWFNLAYLAAGVLIVWLAGTRTNVGLWSGPPLAKVQLFYLVFLWWIVLGNFERAVVGFAPQRLITEGVIHLNALVCSGLILLAPGKILPPAIVVAPLSNLTLAGRALATFIAITFLCWGIVRIAQGDAQISNASRHIRFGPNATATVEKPAAEKPHP